MSKPTPRNGQWDPYSVPDRISEDFVWECILWLQAFCKGALNLRRLRRVLGDVVALFQGRFPGYFPCDTRYHDLEHTLRLIPPFAQMACSLLEDRSPTVGPEEAEWGLTACLLHDSGYLRQRNDPTGTGAKYTFRHIERSVSFSMHYLPRIGYPARAIEGVASMVQCAGIHPALERISFPSRAVRLMGYALATADLLAQMADPRYLHKLPFLFEEFREAYEFEGDERLTALEIQPLKSVQELMARTPAFFHEMVLTRLARMGNLHHLLKAPHSGSHPYLRSIEAHLERIRALVGESSSEVFRGKT